jgi:hypothetical protein
VHKLAKGNDIWALVAVLAEQVDITKQEQYQVNGIPGAVQEVIQANANLFEAPHTLPPSREFDHSISLYLDSIPVNCRPYRYTPQQKDEIERQIGDMLQAGLVTPSLSPHACPVLLVKKTDGSWRFCMDYRKLNANTIKNKFPMPIIDEFVDEIAGSKYFTKLDLNSGFHQIRMAETNEFKTSFKTHHGHFQLRVMPFGLTNAPAMFQCLMNSIFAQFMRKFVLVFMDDILIYSKTLEDHVQHLSQVFAVLRDHKLFIKFKKCAFAQQQIDYLGHIISVNGVSTNPSKISTMVDWPVPKTFTNLRGFLGLTRYYRKFVKNYGILAKPLASLLQNKQFQWTTAAQTTFEGLKTAMTTTPILSLPDFDKQFIIETDACETGIGAVLSQDGHPIAFMSKALSVANRKLSTYEKEFLAILMAVDKWRSYLSRQPFLIRTDHKSLCHLQDQSLSTEMQHKAMVKLAGLHFKLQYKQGPENKAVNALSRVGYSFAFQVVSAVVPVWIQEIMNLCSTDPMAQ